jgi:hypothetical protein
MTCRCVGAHGHGIHRRAPKMPAADCFAAAVGSAAPFLGRVAAAGPSFALIDASYTKYGCIKLY